LGVLALLVPKVRLINFSNLATTTTTTISTVLIVAVSVAVVFISALLIKKFIANRLTKVSADSVQLDKVLIEKTSSKELRKMTAIEKQANWLKTGFDINNMPMGKDGLKIWRKKASSLVNGRRNYFYQKTFKLHLALSISLLF
jgi:hypothetical protein